MDPKNEDCVYLPETLSFLAVEFSSIAIAIAACNHLWHRIEQNPKNSSLPLAAGTWLQLLKSYEDDRATGCLFSPFVHADLP